MPTPIEWTDETWNPITGCTLVSEGCRGCYAARLAATRMKNHPSRKGLARLNAAGEAKFTGEVRWNEQWLTQPLRWAKPRNVFVVAHGDLFHEAVPDEWIDKVFAVMALSPRHTFQVLTKRPERMREYLTRYGRGWDIAAAMNKIAGTKKATLETPLPNVWLGVSIEDQATADARIPVLLDTPAALCWTSAEPLLGRLDISRYLWPTSAEARGLDWVVAGGESGPKARPMHPDWVRSLRDQCAAANVPFLFKYWAEWEENTTGHAMTGRPVPRAHSLRRSTQFTDGTRMNFVGKKAAGRFLDGVLHDAMPQPAAREA